MRAFTVAWKDTRHVYRNVAGLAIMLVAPLLLAFALGAAFGGSSDNFSINAIKTVVVDQDAGAGAGSPAAALAAALSSPDMAKLLAVTKASTPEEARSLVDAGKADVAVIIPQGLSAALMSGAAGAQRAGSATATATVEIYKDPALTIGPAVVSAVVQSVVQSFNGARAAAVAAAELGATQGVDTAKLAALASNTAQAFESSAQAGGQISVDQRVPNVGSVGAKKQPNVASQVLVGMMTFFMLFGAATPARSVLDEHRQGTLSRLFTTPTSRGTILAGKYIAVFLVVLIQAIVLVIAGRFLLGAHWGSFGPLVVLIICSALVAASLGLVCVSFARTPAQAGAASSAIFVFIGLISGNFFGGSGNIGGAYAIARKISPVSWLLDGWNNLLFGGSWRSIAEPVLVALGFTVVLFALATFFFRRRYV